MAEFQEVMRQLNRMCSHYKNCDDDGCPLYGECGNIGIHSSNAKQSMRIEETVEKWAAENPEPVYPTWAEWLEQFGLVTDVVYRRCAGFMYNIAALPIPADIAEKLGIKPKEDV